MKTARFNFALPEDIKKWLEDESKASGLSQATLVLIALKTYIDQQKMLKMSNQFEVMQAYLESHQVKSD